MDYADGYANGADGGRVGEGACELCGRHVGELTRHHLIPRSRHNQKRNKRMFDRREVKERIALLCRPCHKNVHAILDNKELEKDYNTVEALVAHPGIEKFTRWVSKRPGTAVRVRRARR